MNAKKEELLKNPGFLLELHKFMKLELAFICILVCFVKEFLILLEHTGIKYLNIGKLKMFSGPN